MLSDEEKILTKKLRYCEQEYEQDGYLSVGKFEAIEKAVNLIEKQSKEIEELKEKDDLYKKTKQLFENDLLGYIKGYEDGRNGSTGLAYKVGKEFADYNLSLQLNRYKESYLEVRKELDNSVSKDKIKAILGIEENIDEEKILSLLQTIVDENARLEDIEDRKVQIEYNNVFNKGVKSVENKIKAKIKEWDIKDLTICYGGRSQGRTFQQAVRTEVKNILQSLLEKE